MPDIKLILILVLIYFWLIPNGSSNNRFRHAPCKLLLNEVLLRSKGFLEIAKYCPQPGKKNQFNKLDGYFLLTLKGTTNLVVISAKSLDNLELASGIPDVSTTTPQSYDEHRPSYQDPWRSNYQQPSQQDSFSSSQDSVQQYSLASEDRSIPAFFGSSPRASRAINIEQNGIHGLHNSSNHRIARSPQGKVIFKPILFFVTYYPDIMVDDSTYVILLLHYKQSGRQLKQVQHFLEGQELNQQVRLNMKSRVRDFVIVGKTPGADLLRLINTMLDVPFRDQSITPFKSTNIQSINKCDENVFTFSHQNFQHLVPSPWTYNSCLSMGVTSSTETPNPRTSLNYPYNFIGKPVGDNGKKIIVNILWALEHLPKDLFLKRSTETTAMLVNVHEKTIKLYKAKQAAGEIGIAVKRKANPKPVMDQIDNEKKKYIYDVVVSFYKANRIPKLQEILERFVEKVRQNQLALATDETNTPNLFHCGINTFRKIMYDIGYKFGNINKRDAVLFDPRIINWRGKYLKAIRENDAKADGSKWKVIYTDETWFDIYSRNSKGWVPKCPKSVQEKIDHSFGSQKIARGPRIIIMHVGGEDGFVPGMMQVYAVSSKATKEDYHENVKGSNYLKWFQRLISSLTGKGPHLIVMDNAPYHSVSSAPRLNSQKNILLSWLTTQKNQGKQLPALENLRRFELQDLVRTLKSEEPYYVLDNIAREAGHRILRIPPYNCDLNPIELVWSDVKRQLRDQNTDQNLQANILRAQTILQTYGKDYWQNHVKHVKKLEQNYWDGDLEFERTLDRNADIEVLQSEVDEILHEDGGENIQDDEFQFDSDDETEYEPTEKRLRSI